MRETIFPTPVRAVAVLAVLAASVVLCFAQQFSDGFRTIIAEPYDGVIEAVLIGHWFKVARLQQAWNEIGAFYPASDTLGYNDGYLLYGLLSLPFRAAGVDLLRTQEFVHVCVKAIGWLSMFALLRQQNLRLPAAVMGAALFALSINLANQAYHGQLYSVALAPLCLLLLLRARASLPVGRCLPWAAAFLVLSGAWLATSFYMAWFFILFCLACLGVLAATDRAAIRAALVDIRAMRRGQTVALGVVAVMSALPFLLIYLPKLHETHGHGYRAALFYALSPVELFNVGPLGWVWGPIWQNLHERLPSLWRSGEFEAGFTPDVVAALVVLACLSWRFRLTTVQRTILMAGIVLVVLPLSIGGVSPWWLIYRVVPGATGVRTICRLWLFAGFPAAFGVAVLIDRLCARRATVPVALLASMVLIASQVTRQPPTLVTVAEQTARLEAMPAAPPDCRAFFVTDSGTATDAVDALYRDNVPAMLIADAAGVPTVNGFSTFLPPDWNFSALPADTYLARVQRYADAHRLTGLCSYDPPSRRWTAAPISR